MWRNVSEPFQLESMLNSLSETELEYPGFFLDLTNIAKNSGKLPLPRNVSVKKVEALMTWGVIFPIHLEGGKGLAVPIEIIEQFHALEGQEFQKFFDRNIE